METPSLSFPMSGMQRRTSYDEQSPAVGLGRSFVSNTVDPYFPLITPSGIGGLPPLCKPCVTGLYGQHGPGGSGSPGSSNDRALCTNWNGQPLMTSMCNMTHHQVGNLVWPVAVASNGYTNRYHMVGLEQLYYQVLPFADPVNPTLQELHVWNVRVYNHFLFLCGRTFTVSLVPRLMNEATWAMERKFGTYYGAPTDDLGIYPAFIPSLTDQQNYYPGTPSSVRLATNHNQWEVDYDKSVPWWLLFSHILARYWDIAYITNFYNRQVGHTTFGYCMFSHPTSSTKDKCWLIWGGSQISRCP
jgi:hypothetical protein